MSQPVRSSPSAGIITALLASLMVVSACDEATGPVVLLQVGGLSPDVRSLRAMVTLNGQQAKAPVNITESLDLVGLRLPAGATGPLDIVLDGLEAGGCTLKRGDVTAMLSGEPQIWFSVTLQPVPPYELTITPVGDGQGTVQVRPMDVTCDIQCRIPVPACTAVTLSATPSDTTLRGGSGRCPGSDTCQFTMDGPSEVRALFSPRTGADPSSVVIGDLNGDGKPDLAIANRGDNTVSVLLSQGGGVFAAKVDYSTGTEPVAVAMGDLDGDGRPDLVTGNYKDGDQVSVLLNQGGGTFPVKVDYFTGPIPSTVAIGDLNGDGKVDLAVGNAGGNTVSVLLNQGRGIFAAKKDYPTDSAPVAVAMGDLNGDGRPDLVIANYDSNTVSVLLNQGGGLLAVEQDYPTGAEPNAVAIGDLDGNGRPDLVTANYNSKTVSIILNRGW